MSLTVLSVSYPLARVSPDSTGGSEQVLAGLDRALVAAGHRSVVVAPEGSRVAGDLAAIPWITGTLDDAAKAEAQAANRAAIARVPGANPRRPRPPPRHRLRRLHAAAGPARAGDAAPAARLVRRPKR